MGGSTYWMSKFDFASFLEYNRKYKITYFFTVPPIYLLIAKSPLVTDHFAHLHLAISGAAPMGKELQEAASAKLRNGKTWIMQTWGLSETTGSVTILLYGEKDDSGAVSRLLPNCQARLVLLSRIYVCKIPNLTVAILGSWTMMIKMSSLARRGKY